MNRARTILLKALTNHGSCPEDFGEFTKPEKGKIVQKFDSLGPDWILTFDIQPTGTSNDWTNILFSTNASAKKGASESYPHRKPFGLFYQLETCFSAESFHP